MAFIFSGDGEAGFRVGANVLAGDIELPQLVLKKAELEHNISAMSAFCAARGVSLAPHVKTTMAPGIIRRQLAAGAWGVTVATTSQLRVCLSLGARRILLANELVSLAAAQWLGETFATRPGQQLYCLADSVTGVSRLAQGWRASGNGGALPVLVEVGAAGGRTGCRSPAEVRAVARAVTSHSELCLTGVEGFEGILARDRFPENLDRVDAFLRALVESARELEQLGLLADAPELILTAGGSLYFDRAAEILGSARLGRPHVAVLRSGSYVAHDHQAYRGSPLVAGADGATEFAAALELWAEVTSVPEPGLAIAGFGKRDAPWDVGLPVLLGRLPAAGGTRLQECRGVTVSALNDQHAYLDTSAGGALSVGDRIVCGILHPCTAFDKWRQLPLVDQDYRVLETIGTCF